MADDELIDQLKRWGTAKNARHASNDDGYSTRDHVLSRQRDMALAHKRKQEDEREIVGRAGEERRRFMAKNSGVRGMTILPIWAVDPVSGTNDAGPPRDRAPIPIDLVPDDLHWIDRALSRLERKSKIQELVIREEFCEVGLHARKAARVAATYGGSLSVRQYRLELKRALDWLATVREFMAA